ncbi:MAG: rhodanese-like domain-containing protein [Verrucomicrobiota bacterium]
MNAPYSLRRIAILVIAPACLATLTSLIVSKPDGRKISIEDALGYSNALWIDARSAEDFEKNHHEGAIHLNLSNWDRQLPEFLAQWELDQAVIIYCGSDDCQSSLQVAIRLQEAGVSPLHILHGGWEALQRIKANKTPLP